MIRANIIELIPNQVATDTVTGTGVDVSQYTGTAQIVFAASAFGGTTPTCAVKLQGSANNSDWDDITGATFTTVTDAANLSQMISLRVDEQPKFIRAVATIGGTDETGSIAVVALAERQAGYNASQSI